MKIDDNAKLFLNTIKKYHVQNLKMMSDKINYIENEKEKVLLSFEHIMIY